MQRSVALQVGVSWATRTNRTSPLGIFEAALNLVTRIIGHFPRYFHTCICTSSHEIKIISIRLTECRREAAGRIWRHASPATQ